MDTKAAFEKWYAEFTSFREMLAGDKEIMFSAWQASRQAIEVNLENVNHVQVVEGTFYLSESDVNEHLTSLGIRVKGNEE